MATRDKNSFGSYDRIEIKECAGNLSVHGWEESSVLVKGEADVEEADGKIVISSSGDLHLKVNRSAGLFLDIVKGDLVVKNLGGECSIGTVHGDAALSNIDRLRIDSVSGDLVVKNAGATFSAGEVRGDIVVKHVSGVDCETIHGDFTGRWVNGLLNLPQVNGDIRLQGPLSDGEHHLHANGNIVLRWPSDQPVNLTATASEIVNRMSLIDLVEKDGTLYGRTGEGKTHLNLRANGRIVLKETDMTEDLWAESNKDEYVFAANVDMGNIQKRIQVEVDQHMARFAREMESKFGPDFSRRVSEKVARKVERATDRAERAAEKGRSRADARDRSIFSSFGASSQSQTTPAPKAVSLEEQLKILKMVEVGSISPEEANMLLEALGE